ncbi:ABC transporter permease [Devosia epidermidihirudinis]|nr:ABC transporter permease [Devosia epidermidihirudinis]
MDNVTTASEGAVPRQRRRLGFDELGILVAVVLFMVIGSLTSPYFLTVNNLASVLQNITFLGFLCVGVGLVLMAGEIDISVGSIFGLASVVTALMLKNDFPLVLAIGGGLATGLICGLINGILAQAIKVPAVVITLATLGVYRAVALALANGSPVGGLPALPEFFDWFGQGGIGPISFITILFLVVAVIAEVVLRWTSSGYRLLAIGSHPHAATLIGFRVERTRVLVLAFSGLVAGLSGVCSVAYLNTAGPTGGTGYELSALAATIIGGVGLSGGRGSIVGVLLGLCVIGIIQNLIVLWGVSPNWTQGVSGLVLIAAMTLTWLTRRNEGRAH